MSPNISLKPETTPLFPDELADELRRQLFWIVKRHSSYTAWARAFDAFDALIRKMESLLPELAAKPFGTYGMGLPPDTEPFSIWPDWKCKLSWHSEYRAALARLRKGDKRALGFIPPAPLLALQAGRCQNLVYFFQGEHPRDGYYSELDLIIPEKAALTRLAKLAYCLAAENIELTGTSPLDSIADSVDCRIFYSPERRHLAASLPLNPGKPHYDFAICKVDITTLYPIPADLPPVPEPVILPNQNAPWWAPAGQRGGPLVFQSNERVLISGIYLSEPYGDIRYLFPNAAAPFLDLGYMKERELPCTWTLIWRDDRYENGADIPEEEALYFPEESVDARPKGASARPGETCPLTGMWYAPNMPGNHKFIKQGETMPGPENTSFGTVIWYWKQEDPYPGA